MTNRILTVTGKAKIAVPADMIRLDLTLTHVLATYEEAMKHATTLLDRLKTELEHASFEPDDLKTLNFQISTEYEGVQDEKGMWRQVFKGYRYTHIMKLAFDNDPILLQKALQAIQNSGSEPEFAIVYTVSDQEAIRHQVLTKAVQDCHKKAQILCDAANVQLGEIVDISYHWSTGEIAGRQLFSAKMETADAAMGIGFTPEDIETEDSVTIQYQIQS